MTAPEVFLREADSKDLAAIADLFLDCWQTSYRDVLPPHVVAMFDPASARELWTPSLEAEPPRRVVVAEQDGDSILGVITTGDDPDDPGMGHVFSLYVRPATQGLGIGSRLMAEAVNRLRSDGRPRATLWVFEANAAGRAFYEGLGWSADGTTRVEPDYGEPELRLARSLSGTR